MTAVLTLILIHLTLSMAALLGLGAARLLGRTKEIEPNGNQPSAVVHTHADLGFTPVWTAIVIAALVAPFCALTPAGLNVAMPDAAVARLASVARLPETSTWWLAVFAGVYIAGTLLLLTRLAAGGLLVRRLVVHSYPLSGHWLARVHALAPDAASICRIHPRVQVPLTVGILRPAILLPEQGIRWDDDRVLAVLRHELAHVGRRDYLRNIAAAVAQALYWVNPLIWVVTARLRLEAELACDREASGRIGQTRYAAVLVSSARELIRLGRGANRLAPGAASNLEARIAALLAAGRPRPPSRLAPALAVAAIILIVAGALVRIVPASIAGHVGPVSGAAGHAIAHAGRH